MMHGATLEQEKIMDDNMDSQLFIWIAGIGNEFKSRN